MPFAAASVVVPTLEPDIPVEIVVTLDRKMPGNYDISLLKNSPLILAEADVSVVSQTPTTVTLRVVAKQGLAGAGAIFVICN